MAEFATKLQTLMRTISAALNYPVIFVLLILIAAVIVLLGTLIVEIFTEHKQLHANMPQLVDELRKKGVSVPQTVTRARLLKSQKNLLVELTQHKELTSDMREALAERLVEEESDKYERRVLITDLIAKLGPMFGLLGTLIPLGPGIIALGGGDTYTLSQSLLTAFDTTILGLIAAAGAMVISTIRKRWYRNYMSVLNVLTECVLEVEENGQTEFPSQTEE